MKRFLAIIGLFLIVSPMALAQDNVGDKIHEVAHNTAEGVKKAAHAVGEGVKTGAHEVAKTAKKVKNHVIVRCRNGDHAVRRPSACKQAGGVAEPS